MRFTYLYIFLFTCGTFFAQSKKHNYADTRISVEYHTKNGLLDGKYNSHYINGQKKAEGHFKNNLREGKWTVWDSTGKIHYEYVVPIDSSKRNADGYFTFIPLKTEDVVIAKRIWRNIHPENNLLLFSRVNLFDSLYNQIQRDSLLVYMSDDFFNAKIRNKEDIKSNFSSQKYEITGYKVKEDWFFDKKTGAGRVQIIGIYPVLKPRVPESEENIGLGWIYYPTVRKYLAKEIVNEKNSSLKNVDDIFFFHHFYAQIYKEENVYDRSIAAYEKTDEGVAKEAERIEIAIIEMEHDTWINLKKQ